MEMAGGFGASNWSRIHIPNVLTVVESGDGGDKNTRNRRTSAPTPLVAQESEDLWTNGQMEIKGGFSASNWSRIYIPVILSLVESGDGWGNKIIQNFRKSAPTFLVAQQLEEL